MFQIFGEKTQTQQNHLKTTVNKQDSTSIASCNHIQTNIMIKPLAFRTFFYPFHVKKKSNYAHFPSETTSLAPTFFITNMFFTFVIVQWICSNRNSVLISTKRPILLIIFYLHKLRVRFVSPQSENWLTKMKILILITSGICFH